MAHLFIGLMSGTSLDGVDAALIEFAADETFTFRGAGYVPYPEDLRQRILNLHSPGADDLHNAASVGNELARIYAQSVSLLLESHDVASKNIVAIGCHGQTVRHNPAAGYTLQLNNPALLAELTDISVVADFRSRDIAAGGQGAPLVPAFHDIALRHPEQHRIILNIGGIANLTDLAPQRATLGFDTGVGNMLLDAWIHAHSGARYDANGAWAAQGKLLPDLLARLLSHEYLALTPPKSCGREQFNLAWLRSQLKGVEQAADVQATLVEFTVQSCISAILRECGAPTTLIVCGGGARNPLIMAGLQRALPQTLIKTTDAFGYPADWLEAIAFAWLAQRTLCGQAGNLPAVTGARGERVLGAIYPR